MLPGKQYRPEDYVDILWRRKWLAIVPFTAITLATLMGTQFLPNRYRSDARILIVPQQVPENFVQSTITTSLDSRLQAISQQILSRTRLERIIQELNLYEEERRTMIMEDVIERMRRDTSIEIPRTRGRRDDLGSFTVGFASENARMAMQVTERLASQFITESLQDRTVQADQTSQFLQAQLEEARRKLAEHEQKFAQFRQRYAGELPTQVQSNLAVMQSTQAQLQAVTEAMNRDRDRQLVLDKTIADLMSMNTAVPERAASPRDAPAAPPTAAGQLQAARSALRELQLRLKPEHPDVVRAQRVVRELADKAAAEELNGPVGVGGGSAAPSTLAAADLKRLSEMQAERESLDRRIANGHAEEARLQGMLSAYRSKVEAAPSREAESTELMRDYETLDEQYRTLLGRSQQSRIAADLERRQIGEQFRLIDPARLPERPISPDRPRLNMLGAMAGLSIGLALIALVEYRNTTFRTEDDLALSLAVPVLAVIPAMLSRPELQRAKKRRLIAVSASLVTMTGIIGIIVWKIDDIANWVRVMYESFFGVSERPFDLTPNPRYLVLTDAHREALSNLEYAIASRKGVTLLLGEAGTGKTTIIRAALERQPERVHCVHLQNPALNRTEFVEMLATRFGLGPRSAASKTTLLLELEALLTARNTSGESSVLVVDEAQSLSLELLEEIRLLANIETSDEKLLSVILAGQPELADRLNEQSLRQLKQRVALRCQLSPLTLQESCAYIAGRIRAAGGLGAQTFTREAVTLMHERAHGIPRTLNVIADNALLTAFATARRPVNTKVVLEVCRDLDLHATTTTVASRKVAGGMVQPPKAPTGPVRLITIDSGGAPADEVAEQSTQVVGSVPDIKRRRFSFLRAAWIRGTNESS